MPTDRPKVTYGYSRLTFKRDLIEPLDVHDYFCVETPDGIFQMTKNDFYRVFENVTESGSYKIKGLYNYTKVPNKALQFLVNKVERYATEKRYLLPPFLVNVCTSEQYKRWLHRKAMAHFKRDSKRRIKNISCSSYKQAIHQAVLNGGQYDAYTGEPLNWTLISKYDNEDSKAGKREYKKKFGNLPTIDHFDGDYDHPTFRICSWRLNDCKNDLKLDEFLEVCRNVLRYQKDKERTIIQPVEVDNIQQLTEFKANVRLFKMSDEWKKETVVDTAAVDKHGNIGKSKKIFRSRKWKDDCLIISLDICDGDYVGDHILLWPLSDNDANAPGVMNLYLSKEDIHVELKPTIFPIYKP